MFGIVANPFIPFQFVTHGVRHLKIWTHELTSLDDANMPTKWRSRTGIFNVAPIHVRALLIGLHALIS